MLVGNVGNQEMDFEPMLLKKASHLLPAELAFAAASWKVDSMTLWMTVNHFSALPEFTLSGKF